MTNNLGVPESAAGWVDMLREVDRVLRGDMRNVLPSLQLDMQLSGATRWQWSPKAVHPSHRVPGDVLGLRARAVMLDIDENVARLPHAGLRARAMYAASTYWVPTRLPVSMAQRVGETPHAGEVRIGEPVAAVWWPSPVSVDVGPAPEMLAVWADDTRPVPVDVPWPVVDAGRMFAAASRSRVDLDGVVLFASADGKVADVCGWVVSTHERTEIRTAPIGHVILGRPSWSAWPALPVGLAALVAWGDWHPPQGGITLPVHLKRPDLRSLTSPKLRKLEQAGALGNVRVLAAPKPPAEVDAIKSAEPTSTHARPVAHYRRGHWRRVWTGPAEEKRSEWRWIEPTLVNGHWVDDERVTVWRLPRPK